MSWIKQNSNLYTHSDAPFSLQYIGSTWYLVDNRDQSKAIPFSDIFNNPAYAIDLSNQDVLVNSLSSASFVNATHLRSETANTPATPGHSFKTEINSGMYRISAGKIGFSSLGSRVGEFGADYGGFTGNIIQVQSTTKTNIFNTASTNYTNITGLNVSITPKYSSSKILILITIYIGMTVSSNGCLRLDRNGTAIFENTGSAESGFANFNTSNVPSSALCFNITALDSPNSTSSLTYTLQTKVSSGTIYIGSNSSGYYGLISSITAMEIQQ